MRKPRTEHIQKPRFVDPTNNNIVERLNGTVREREKVMRGTKEEVRDIIGETGLFGKMESGEFDNQLIQEFKSDNLSALCISVYKAGSKGPAYLDSIVVKMVDFVKKLQKRHWKKLDENQIKLLVDPVIFVLQSWGAIIEGFSGEIAKIHG